MASTARSYFEQVAGKATKIISNLNSKHPLVPPFLLVLSISAAFPILGFLAFFLTSVVIGLIIFAVIEIASLVAAAVILFWSLVFISVCVGTCFVWAFVAYQIVTFLTNFTGTKHFKSSESFQEKQQPDHGSTNDALHVVKEE